METRTNGMCQPTWRIYSSLNTIRGKHCVYRHSEIYFTFEHRGSKNVIEWKWNRRRFLELINRKKQAGGKSGMAHHQRSIYWPYIMHGQCMYWISIALCWAFACMDVIICRSIRWQLASARSLAYSLECTLCYTRQDDGCGLVQLALSPVFWAI